MVNQLVRREFGKQVLLGGVLAAVLIAAFAPAAQAGRNTSSVKYDLLIGNAGPTAHGLFGDQAPVATYGPTTSTFLFSYTNTSVRTLTATLAQGVTTSEPVRVFEPVTVFEPFICRHGLVAGGDNPLVTCYSDATEEHGYFIDFPPYGNDNKRNRAANPACATFQSNEFGGYTTNVPATCLAQVSYKENGVTTFYKDVSMPFTFETRVQTATTP